MGALQDILGVAAAVADPVLDFLGVSQTNATNQSINKETREWQTQENMWNRAWQAHQMQIQREWQSPANQYKLYREAGLNPLISQSAQIGSAASPAPPSGSTQGSPSTIPAIAPKFNLSGMAERLANISALQANTANSSAAAFSKFVDAIPTISKYLGPEATKSLLGQYLPQLGDVGYSGSQAFRLLENDITRQSLQNRVAEVDANIAEKYGEDKAFRILTNLEWEGTKLVSEIGKLASDASVNESIKDVNNARIDELLSESYRNFKLANKYAAETLTENELRELWKSRLTFEVGNDAMEFLTNEADYDEMSFVRKFKHSTAAKYTRDIEYASEANPVTIAIDYVTKRANKLFPSSPGMPSVPAAPWQTRYVKRRKMTPTYTGKQTDEWYAPIQP